MRVRCIQPAGDPVSCGSGPVRIGSSPDDDVALAGAGVSPHHLSITADARGLVLSVTPGCRRVYVNARAVGERALLHAGDTLTVGRNKLRVSADEAPPDPGPLAVVDPAAADPVRLRIVSGNDAGRALTVGAGLRLGTGSRHFGELDFACRIVPVADGLALEADNAKPQVNGWNLQRARLACGDQIVLGAHRLLVEAPALQHAASIAARPPAPVPVETLEADGDSATSHVAIGWLIAAAAALAAAIALTLYFAG